MQDEGLCGDDGQEPKVVISVWVCRCRDGLEFTLNGCAPQFALWSFKDLGYLTYYVTYLLATGALQGVEGETFEAGRMGVYTIEKDPTREAGLRVLMGPFTIYDASNVEEAAK
jgi:rhamnose transport system substrate-binding protein